MNSFPTTIPRMIPITELKNTNALSTLCQEADAPIVVTKNGYKHLVIMTVEAYEREMFRSQVYRKLDEAEAQIAAGSPLVDSEYLLDGIRSKLNSNV